MHCAFPLLLAALASFGATAPTPALLPRACTTISPTLMQAITSSDPDNTSNYLVVQADGNMGGSFHIRRESTNVSNPLNQLQYLDFEVPSGSYGCQLYVTDEASRSIVYHRDTSSLSPPTVKVKSLVANAFRARPSYNDIVNAHPSMISSGCFGTFSLPNGKFATINSQACPPPMYDGETGHSQFVFELIDHSDGTTSSFSMDQRSAGVNRAVNGVYMTFNC